MRTSVGQEGHGGHPSGSGNAVAMVPGLPEPVAIIGASGALGFGLAIRWGRAGVPVVIGSRDAGRAEEAAARARELVPGGDFTPAANAEAAAAAEVVVLCVPFRNQSETLTNLKETLREGQIVVDATVPLAAAVSGKATRLLGVWQGSAAQQAQEMVPDGVQRRQRPAHRQRRDRCATSTPSSTRTSSSAATAGPTRSASMALIDAIDGLRPVDCGRLEKARIVEGLTPLLISINIRNKTHAGIRDHRACRSTRDRRPGRRHRRRQARPRAARRGRRRPRRDRQHRRRRRDLRRARLPRPRPVRVLAGRPHRRARLGPARRHVPRDGPAARAGRRRLVQPRRPRPRDRPAPRRAAGRRARRSPRRWPS